MNSWYIVCIEKLVQLIPDINKIETEIFLLYRKIRRKISMNMNKK